MTEPSLKRKVESVLFSAGKYLPVKEIAQLCGRNTRSDSVLKALKELQEEYEQKDSSLMVATDGENWKLTVREAYSPIVRRIVSTTELAKSVMETLAVIAYKAPVLQSEVIHIRTNKAYEHIKELHEAGFITRKPEGRTKRIDLTQKFFDYFDLPPEDLQKRFARIKELDEHVKLLEEAADERKQAHADKTAEVKEHEEQMKAEFERTAEELDQHLDAHPKIQIISQKGEEEILEEYTVPELVEASPVHPAKDHLGDLEVVDAKAVPVEAEGGKEWGELTVVKMKGEVAESAEGKAVEGETAEGEATEESESTEPTGVEHKDVAVAKMKETERLKLPEGSDKRIDVRVEELLSPEKERERKEKELAERGKRLEEGPKKPEEKEEEEKQKEEVAPTKETVEEPSEEAAAKEAEKSEEQSTEETEEDANIETNEQGEANLDEVSKAIKDL